MTAGLDGCALEVTKAGWIIHSYPQREKEEKGAVSIQVLRELYHLLFSLYSHDAGFSDVDHTSRNSINVWDANTDVQIVLSLYFDLTLQ